MHAGQLQIPSHHSIQSNTSSTMRWNACRLENIDIALQRSIWIQSLEPDPRLELIWQMQTLTTAQNLLSSHHEIECICDCRILRVGHGIEWSGIRGKFVEDVEIGMEFLPHESTESLLLRCAHVFVIFD